MTDQITLLQTFYPTVADLTILAYDLSQTAYQAFSPADRWADKAARLQQTASPDLTAYLQRYHPLDYLTTLHAASPETWPTAIDQTVATVIGWLLTERPDVPLTDNLLMSLTLWSVRADSCQDWLFGWLGDLVSPPERSAIINLLSHPSADFLTELDRLPARLAAEPTLNSALLAVVAQQQTRRRLCQPLAERLQPDNPEAATQIADLWAEQPSLSRLRSALHPPVVRVEGKLFVGRHKEQTEFRRVMSNWARASTTVEQSPQVFLLQGEGGWGKSTLGRRLQDIARREFGAECRLLALDWQQRRYHNSALNNPTAFAVLDDLAAALRQDDGSACCPEYERVSAAWQAAQKAVGRLLNQPHEGRWRALSGLSLSDVRRILRGDGQPDEPSPTLLEEFLQARLDSDIRLWLHDPERRLAQALGRDIRQVSRPLPLLLFMDTYELVDRVDLTVRLVIEQAGGRTAWLIGGRNRLSQRADGLGHREQLRQVTVWDMEQLAQAELTRYLHDLLPERPVGDEAAQQLTQLTKGIPLAVQLVGDLWQRQLPLSDIIGRGPLPEGRAAIIRTMAERVLRHVDSEADERAIYFLAMQPSPDLRMQQAILGHDLSAELQRLQRRYSTVRRTADGLGQLHDEMRQFVQQHLLTNQPLRRGAVVQPLAAQACQVAQTEWAALSEEFDQFEERLLDEEWQAATLSHLHWQLWLQRGERAAWAFFVPRLVEAWGYDEPFATALLHTRQLFLPTMPTRWQKRFALGLPSDSSGTPFSSDHQAVLGERLAEQTALLPSDDPTATAIRQTILPLQRGRWQTEQQPGEAAFQTLTQAADLCPPPANRLAQTLATAFNELAARLLWPDKNKLAIPSELGLQAAQQATRFDPHNQPAWYYTRHGNRFNSDFQGD